MKEIEKKSTLEKLIRTIIDDIKEDILKAKSDKKNMTSGQVFNMFILNKVQALFYSV